MRAQPKRTDWADTYNGTTTISVGTLEVQVSIASSSDIAVVAHGPTKEAGIPARDIERAIERKRRYEQDPEKHRATLDV